MKFGLRNPSLRKRIAAGRSRNAISGCLAATFVCLFLCCGGPVLPEHEETNQQTYAPPSSQRPQLAETPAAPVGPIRRVYRDGEITAEVSALEPRAVVVEEPAPPINAPPARQEQQAELRTWKDSTGRFSVTAAFVGLADDQVRLRRASGETVTVPVERLSDADQQFVRSISAPTPAGPAVNTIAGEVISVTDGDTIIVLDEQKTNHRIRLEGIDAPESGQAFGTQSRKALADKVFRQQVRVEWDERDRYDRILGHVYVGDRWINRELVAEGWAWHYKQYSSDAQLAEAELRARQEKAGLWSHDNAVPPWQFRRTPNLAERPPPAGDNEIDSSGVDDAPVYVTRTGGKYHRAGCRYLAKSQIPISLEEAQLKYEPCSVCDPPHTSQATGGSSRARAPPALQQQAIVYVTRTGEKYHRDGCRHLHSSKIPMPLDRARLSYGPCSVCRPP